MKNKVNKIKLFNGINRAGFLLIIYYNKNSISVLLINNGVAIEEVLDKDKIVLLAINYTKKQLGLKIKNIRLRKIMI